MFDLLIRDSLCANELGNQDYHVNGIIDIHFVHGQVYDSVVDVCMSTFFNKWIKWAIVYHCVKNISMFFLNNNYSQKSHTFKKCACLLLYAY